MDTPASPGLGPLPAAPSRYGRLHGLRDGFLYAGVLAEIPSQRHSALLYLALDGEPFALDAGGRTQHVTAAVLRPGVRKRLLGRPSVACVDVSPLHRDYPAFTRAPEPVQAWPHDAFLPLLPALREFRAGGMPAAQADRLYARVVECAVQRLPPTRPVDPRVRRVMALLRENRHRTLDDLAQAVCLSKDWLVHLFLREAGISLRKYEQTIKLHTAAAFVNRGVSMTRVAAIAGFADAAHFSRMWKQHYGLPPQRMFGGQEYIAVDPMPGPARPA